MKVFLEQLAAGLAVVVKASLGVDGLDFLSCFLTPAPVPFS